MSTTSTRPADEELERVRALPEAIAALIPEFEAEPCPAKEIAKLERAHGVELPPWYRLYLELLGRSVGQIRYYGDVDLRPKTLIKWAKKDAVGSPRYLLIGLAEGDSDWDLYIDRGEDGQGVGVVSFEQPGEGSEDIGLIQRIASSFATYILRALASQAITDMPATGTIGARGPELGKLPRVRKQLAKFGAEEHPLSGAWDKLYVGPRMLALGTEFGGEQSVAVRLGCMAHDEWWEIAGALEHELGLQISRPPT